MGHPHRRRWTAEETRRIVEETRAPGSSVSMVARRHDLNANLLFKWKRRAEAGRLDGPLAPAAAPEFVPVGVVGRASDGGPALLAGAPNALHPIRQSDPSGRGEPRSPAGLETRTGVIEIDLPDGTRVRVDAFVDARALARVLGALKAR